MSDASVITARHWTGRVRACGGDLQRAVFDGNADAFAEAHARQMAQFRAAFPGGLDRVESIIDVGCGYGRLLSFIPDGWPGRYVGVDLCPDFVQIARVLHPNYHFYTCDARALPFRDGEFDVAVSLWFKDMVTREAGPWVWAQVAAEMARVAKKSVNLS